MSIAFANWLEVRRMASELALRRVMKTLPVALAVGRVRKTLPVAPTSRIEIGSSSTVLVPLKRKLALETLMG